MVGCDVVPELPNDKGPKTNKQKISREEPMGVVPSAEERSR